jgi:hypothetical protein
MTVSSLPMGTATIYKRQATSFVLQEYALEALDASTKQAEVARLRR